MNQRRPRNRAKFTALKALAVTSVTAVFALNASAAMAVPGESVGAQVRFPSKNKEPAIDDWSGFDRGRAVTKLDDGRYLAFGQTVQRRRLARDTYFIHDLSTLKVRRFSRNGKPDRRFDRSEIGRGIRIGSYREVWTLKEIVKYSNDLYFAWARVDSDPRTLPRFAVIGFNPITGRVSRAFGKNGVLRFGKKHSSTDHGLVRTSALELLSDGRFLACGGHEYALPSGQGRSRPFVNTFAADSKSLSPFFASGSRYLDLETAHPELHYWDCRTIVQMPSGRVVIAGVQDTDGRGEHPMPWVGAFQPDGTPDLSFGNGGDLEFPEAFRQAAGGELYPRDSVATPDGKLYVAGLVVGGKTRGFVARLDALGQLDPTFGSGGLVTTSQLTVDDISVGVDGALLISGPTTGDGGAPTVGRLLEDGSWDPNFFGRGYRKIDMFALTFYQVTEGPTVELWGSQGYEDFTDMVQIENQVTLDSSITKLQKRRGGRVSIDGLASSPTGLARVEFAIAPAGSAPSVWTAASGTHLWSASAVLPKTRKKLVVYSRAIGLDGTTESEFSTADKNRLVVE